MSRLFLTAALFCMTACSPSEKPPAEGKDPAPLREAGSCEALADAYINAERDTVNAGIDQATKDPKQDRPQVRFDPALREVLREQATKLSCAPAKWPGLLFERIAVLARQAGHGIPPGELNLVAAVTDDRRFHWHQGRVYMYSMFPAGKLTAKDGAPADFTYDSSRHEYVDEAGITWLLWQDGHAEFHQPDGSRDYPNKKFTAVDASGGSFEAVLLPDGASANHNTRPPYRYQQGNWLTTGPKIGTYNYADSHADHWWWGPDHFLNDMLLHGRMSDYPEAPRQRLIDPRGDWSTFVPRFEKIRLAIGRAGTKVVRGADGSLSIVTESGPAEGSKVDADLHPLLQEWLDGTGTKIEGAPREDPVAGFNRLHKTKLPVCGAKPVDACLAVLRDNGSEAVVGIALGFHYADAYLLRIGDGGWQVAESYELTVGEDDSKPAPAWVPSYLVGR